MSTSRAASAAPIASSQTRFIARAPDIDRFLGIDARPRDPPFEGQAACRAVNSLAWSCLYAISPVVGEVPEQALERRLDPERVGERPVLGRQPRSVTVRALGPCRPQEHVLRRVLERDELDDLDVVPGELEQAGACGVRHLRDEALPKRSVPEQRPQDLVLELPEKLVLAARDGEDHARARADCAVERRVGRSVAGVQADHEVDAVEDRLRRCRRPRTGGRPRRAAVPAPRTLRRRRP